MPGLYPDWWWPVQDGGGARAYDVGGRAQHLTIYGTGASDWVAGPFGRALNFDENDNYMSHAGAAPWNTLSDVSVSVWLHSDGQSASRWVFNKYLSLNDQWGIYVDNSDNIAIWDDIDNAATTRYSTALGSGWHHVVAVMSSLENLLYLDGQLIGNGGSSSGDWSSFAGGLFFGQYGAGSYFDGQMNNLGVFSRALHASEIGNTDADPWAAGTLRQRVFKAVAAAAVAPTSHLYGPLVGPLGGPV
jgi:hypothetical protein